MKKDFFNGNIKREFVSYIWTTIILVTVIFFGCSGLFLYFYFFGNLEWITSLLFLVLGVILFCFGIWYSFGTIFIIKTYPKYKKVTKWFLNSDCYFVDSDSKEYHGHWWGRVAFNKANRIAQQNEGSHDIRYPKKYRLFIALTIIGIFFVFLNIFVVWVALGNMSVLPLAFQSEGIIFVVFIVFEVIGLILSFAFASRVKKIRKKALEEYRAKQRKNDE